jgi:hypothetical protein
MQQTFLSNPWQSATVTFTLGENGLGILPYIPTGKLDADQYSAEDSHGVTESLLGSGNLSYASLQSSQTDAALQAQQAMERMGDVGGHNKAVPEAVAQVSGSINPTEATHSHAAKGNPVGQGATDTDRAVAETVEDVGTSQSAGFNPFMPSSAALGAAHFQGSGGGGSGGANNGKNGVDGTNSTENAVPPTVLNPTLPPQAVPLTPSSANGAGKDGANGATGTNGTNGEGGGDTTVYDTEHSFITVKVNVEDVTNMVNHTVTTLGNTLCDVTNVVNNTSHLLQHLLHHTTHTGLLAGEQVTQLVSSVTTHVTQVTSNLLTEVTHLSGTLQGIVGNIGCMGGIQLPDLTLCDLLGGNGGTPVPDLGHLSALVEALPSTVLSTLQGGGEALGNAISQLEGTLQQIGDAIPTASEALQGLHGVAETVTHQVGSTLSCLGLENICVPTSSLASVVEGVGALLPQGDTPIGDGDLGIDLSALGQEISLDGLGEWLTNPVEDVAGDIDLNLHGALDVLDASNTSAASGDTDLTVNTGVDLVDHAVLGGGGDITLDPVEQITGDIDVDVGAAINVLGDQADRWVNDGVGGSGGGLLADVGDLVQNSVGGVLAGSEDNAASGDTDLTATIDVSALGVEAPLHFDVSLDAVEQITGDIDVNVDGAISLLGRQAGSESIANSAIGAEASTAVDSWTESIQIGGSETLSDMASGIAGAGDALPDPVGTVDHGISILHTDPIFSGGGHTTSGGHGLFG